MGENGKRKTARRNCLGTECQHDVGIHYFVAVQHIHCCTIQARTKAFSNTIKEFVMKRSPPNEEILHFYAEYVISNNVGPFDNQGKSVDHAVLLDLTRTSTWKSIKNRWFITTDRNTKMFLKYLTERKRFAFRNRTYPKIKRSEDIIGKL